MDAAALHEARVAQRRAHEVAAAGAAVHRVTQIAAKARSMRDTTTMEIDGRQIAQQSVVARREPTPGEPVLAQEALARIPVRQPLPSASIGVGELTAEENQAVARSQSVVHAQARAQAQAHARDARATDIITGLAGIGMSASAGAQAKAPLVEALQLAEEVAPIVGDLGEPSARTGSAQAVQGGRTWTPTEVPAPSYTLAPRAETWEPAPLTEADFEQARAAAERLAPHTGLTGKIPIPPRAVFGDSAIDINTAIKRRRAHG